ncbi:hypothetical protein NP233_g9551 [Leucocoprinus birnbaumii]|uniref:Uncharacterized protein n=1 Tax=Leucocoprinus birnbaumii TaxID=56174 RepID=A0AAD5YSR9_9AGAR|nr:hypothetical protein NP233_g9551 [Leucocoprinus birnbaumii]
MKLTSAVVVGSVVLQVMNLDRRSTLSLDIFVPERHLKRIVEHVTKAGYKSCKSGFVRNGKFEQSYMIKHLLLRKEKAINIYSTRSTSALLPILEMECTIWMNAITAYGVICCYVGYTLRRRGVMNCQGGGYLPIELQNLRFTNAIENGEALRSQRRLKDKHSVFVPYRNEESLTWYDESCEDLTWIMRNREWTGKNEGGVADVGNLEGFVLECNDDLIRMNPTAEEIVAYMAEYVTKTSVKEIRVLDINTMDEIEKKADEQSRRSSVSTKGAGRIDPDSIVQGRRYVTFTLIAPEQGNPWRMEWLQGVTTIREGSLNGDGEGFFFSPIYRGEQCVSVIVDTRRGTVRNDRGRALRWGGGTGTALIGTTALRACPSAPKDSGDQADSVHPAVEMVANIAIQGSMPSSKYSENHIDTASANEPLESLGSYPTAASIKTPQMILDSVDLVGIIRASTVNIHSETLSLSMNPPARIVRSVSVNECDMRVRYVRQYDLTLLLPETTLRRYTDNTIDLGLSARNRYYGSVVADRHEIGPRSYLTCTEIRRFLQELVEFCRLLRPTVFDFGCLVNVIRQSSKVYAVARPRPLYGINAQYLLSIPRIQQFLFLSRQYSVLQSPCPDPAMAELKSAVLSAPRLTTLVASFLVTLGSGTNYVFSAWGPQLGSQLRMSHTQLNIIGFAGNVGVQGSGPIWGRIADKRGPRIPLAGAFALILTGYSGIRYLFDSGTLEGTEAASVLTFVLVVLCSLMTGAGGGGGIISAMNSTAKSFPDRARATATGLVIAGFGLSAFLFSTIAHVMYAGNTSAFLRLLAIGTSLPMVIGFFFVRPVPLEPSAGAGGVEHGIGGIAEAATSTSALIEGSNARLLAPEDSDVELDEQDVPAHSSRSLSNDDDHTPNVFGAQLWVNREFWVLFTLLSLLGGTGLMYINNVGTMARTLYASNNPQYNEVEAVKWQAAQVSTISVTSFSGRMLIGIISDFARNTFGFPRSYCLVLVSAAIFLSQVAAGNIDEVGSLWVASSMLGLAYGSVFSLFPQVCIEWFGLPHFSENWGYLALAPIFAGNLFMLYFGRNLDAHEAKSLPELEHTLVSASSPSNTSLNSSASVDVVALLRKAVDMLSTTDEAPKCLEGRSCYIAALYLTSTLSFGCVLLSVWAAWKDRRKRLRMLSSVYDK